MNQEKKSMQNIQAALTTCKNLANQESKSGYETTGVLHCTDKSLHPVLERTGTVLWVA